MKARAWRELYARETRPVDLRLGIDEVDVVRRALVLRKAKRIGILLAEEGKYWISDDLYDPHGSRRRISLEELKALVEIAEKSTAIPAKGIARFDLNSCIADKNKSAA